MSDKVFENYDEAHQYSLTVPWKLETCNVGESCWCRIIVPIEPIKYLNKIGNTERVDEIDYIIPDGSIDKETAEYFLKLHNNLLQREYHIKSWSNAAGCDFVPNQEKIMNLLEDLNKIEKELGIGTPVIIRKEID
jgi:hypothetical protein